MNCGDSYTDHCRIREREEKPRVRVVYDILLEFVYPPIPVRSQDWRATRPGNYEPGMPMGTGPTPEAALADLLEQENDREPSPT